MTYNPKSFAHRTLRNTMNPIRNGEINGKIRNKMMMKEKMSTLFTKNRRIAALNDFEMRLEMTLQKKKLKKKILEDKYYDFDFKPRTNKRRINIYSKKIPDNVLNTIKKKTKPKKKLKRIRSTEDSLNKTIRKKIKSKNVFRNQKNDKKIESNNIINDNDNVKEKSNGLKKSVNQKPKDWKDDIFDVNLEKKNSQNIDFGNNKKLNNKSEKEILTKIEIDIQEKI